MSVEWSIQNNPLSDKHAADNFTEQAPSAGQPAAVQKGNPADSAVLPFSRKGAGAGQPVGDQAHEQRSKLEVQVPTAGGVWTPLTGLAGSMARTVSDTPEVKPSQTAGLHTVAASDPIVVREQYGRSEPEVSKPYQRTRFSGKVVNVRTRELLLRAQHLSGLRGGPTTISLNQGSYTNRHKRSAGTHAGGGVVDISTAGLSKRRIDALVQALREAGMAAWYRDSRDRLQPHIHAVAIGDKELSAIAKRQVDQYFGRRNGLRNRGRDRHANLEWWVPAWALPREKPAAR